ncbi:MAG: tryptophan synthase subunit alpha [Clostridiales Family XIII bacterium]|jgi:tryptophan synthase alpha chain|nr:tryptophan synthase subunit alpha [Clostridiales Family XIII bacterium]
MSNIAKAFDHGKAFIGFVTGGDPSIESTKEFVIAMWNAGCDLIEIGVPFSDPIAEGPVIQAANLRSLAAGVTTDSLLDLVAELREGGISVPLVFLTYLNPVYHYGYEAFFAKAAESGLDGIIIPDLPFEEQHEVKPIASKYGIDIISLVAPTSEGRVKMIAARATGFVYLVSSMGVTGVRREITTDLASITGRVKAVTDMPVAVGFGVHTPGQARAVAESADGVIVGSAIVKMIEEHGAGATPHIADYVRKMKEAVSST